VLCIYTLTFSFKFYGFVNRALTHLQPTTQRLGAAAASTNVYAGYKVSITHDIFRGVTAAVEPNRKLAAGIFVF
jgi:hypothetical protein